MSLPPFLQDLSIPFMDYHHMAREWCQEMRRTSPVFYEEGSDVWLVFRHEDAMHMRTDYKTFSSKGFLAQNTISSFRTERSIIAMDPPEHRQMRSLVTKAFSAQTIAQLAPQIEQIVDTLIDRVQAQGEMDWINDMTVPLPVMVIADLLGLPPQEWRQYKYWTDTIMERGPGWQEAQRDFERVFDQLIEDRTAKPQADILTHLINAEIDGEHLSHEDLLGFCRILFVAGNITTTNTLGCAMILFDEHPDAFADLRLHPELIPSAVEEILRYMPPGRITPRAFIEGRVTTTRVTMGGQTIPEGGRVLALALANNFDESAFDTPERFDIRRNPNRHLSFGHGIHFCLGAPLARLEMKIALEKVVQRLPDIHRAEHGPIEAVESNLLFGPKRLPMAFSPQG